MKNETYSYRTADGLTLFAQSWVPDTAPRRVIALVHGLGEHGGRYDHVAGFFGRSGYAMTMYDLPLFLYGHSLGGLQVLSYLLERQPAASGASAAEVSCIVAASPLLATAEPVSAFKLLLAWIVNRVTPGFAMDNGLRPSDLSRDPEVRAKAGADPLYHRKVTAGMGLAFMQAGERVRAYRGPVGKPLLLMQGTADAIVSPEATIGFAGGLTGDVTLKTWEGMFHELHNEPEREEILSFVGTWMETRA